MSTATLSATLWPTSPTPAKAWSRNLALVIAGVMVMTISAQVKIPFWPVPMTLQTVIVLVLGLGYGLRLGLTTIVSYLAIGALGVPVFATGGGVAYLLGPTGGYLFGFVIATAVLGYLGERGWGKTLTSTAVAMFGGLAIILTLGVAWLSYVLGDFGKALSLGLYPFLLAEVVKMLVASKLVPLTWQLAKKENK